MKNAISRFGYTCAATALFCIVGGVMSAETMNRVTVNLPEDTLVGDNTLAAGSYTITDIEPAPGVHVFVFRGENRRPVMLQAETIEQSSEPSKSTVVLTRKGSEVRINKLLIEGSSLGYEFEPVRQNNSREQK